MTIEILPSAEDDLADGATFYQGLRMKAGQKYSLYF